MCTDIKLLLVYWFLALNNFYSFEHVCIICTCICAPSGERNELEQMTSKQAQVDDNGDFWSTMTHHNKETKS